MPAYYDRLTPHFYAGELGADRAPGQYQANIRRTADYLEIVRAVAGVPLGKVSGWRTPRRNEQVGGSDTSSHLTGEAGDFTPQGRTSFAVYNDLKRAHARGALPAFDQIIYYPFGHLHVGLGPRNRRQFLMRISEKHYALDTAPAPNGSAPPVHLTTGETDVITIAAISFVILVVLVVILA